MASLLWAHSGTEQLAQLLHSHVRVLLGLPKCCFWLYGGVCGPFFSSTEDGSDAEDCLSDLLLLLLCAWRLFTCPGAHEAARDA
jgi:hypothetical protein